MKTLSLFLAILAFNSLRGQSQPAAIEAVPATTQSYWGFDVSGNQYTSDAQQVFARSGTSPKLTYQNLSLGKITAVSLQNPLQLLLFYGNFNTVVLLDNQLNEIRRVNFSDLPDQPMVLATGLASRNRLWIFDSVSQRIGLVDYLAGTMAFLTPPLQGNLRVSHSNFNYFEWIDNHGDWYRCDVFGKITKVTQAPDFEHAALADDGILVGQKAGQWFVFNANSGRSQRLEPIDKAAKSFFLKDKILAIFTGLEIISYKINLP